ncbi:hypothetical protein [Streptomyces sp. NPDC093111]
MALGSGRGSVLGDLFSGCAEELVLAHTFFRHYVPVLICDEPTSAPAE